MASIKGIKPGPKGEFWCNVILSDGTYKLCIAKLIDEETMLFNVRTNGSRIQQENDWDRVYGEHNWRQKEMFAEDINQFFNWNYHDQNNN